ncbi:Carboxy-terminal domain (CTD) phosphatase [Salix suchowensis]|nr:Carboxy-terminal domain (CTD) phosphatase [Salix suchowensis]
MSGPTELYLPLTFPFPIKVISIDAKPASNIQRGQRLLSYSFVHLAPTVGAQPETRFGTWDSTVEGGDVISARKAKDKPVVLVNEPCTHGIQIGGLCGLCGKDMTEYVPREVTVASGLICVPRSHSDDTLCVRAYRLSRGGQEDGEGDSATSSQIAQIVLDCGPRSNHCACDRGPDRRRVDNGRRGLGARRAAKAKNNESNDNDDECNPNWEALKDVKKFRLGPESFGPPPRFPQGKAKLLENEGCMYYIKPRGMWAIDPDSKYFGGRILSRDESGTAPSSTPPNTAAAEHALPSETPIITPEDAERAERETNQMLKQNSLALEAQMEERPLAKKQEALVASEDGQATKTETPSPAESTGSETVVDTPPPTEKHVRKALLKNDDFELERLSKVLRFVALWRHQDETPYLLDEPPVTGPSSSPAMDSIDISSDLDPDGDDWDKDPPSGPVDRRWNLIPSTGTRLMMKSTRQ